VKTDRWGLLRRWRFLVALIATAVVAPLMTLVGAAFHARRGMPYGEAIDCTWPFALELAILVGILVFLRLRPRRVAEARVCAACGKALGPDAGTQCPACGAAVTSTSERPDRWAYFRRQPIGSALCAWFIVYVGTVIVGVQIAKLGLTDPIATMNTAMGIGVLLGGLTAIVVRLLLRPLSKPKPGICASCGYNLTGNVSGVCPECGARVEGAG
jgi:predicted RNA-binding Zn-ribbon protein involved in translation (DUF1610 family)